MKISRTISLLLACGMMAAWTLFMAVGCRSQPETIELQTPPDEAPVAEEKEEETVDAWEQLKMEGATDPRTRPKFIPAEDARKSPTLRLQTFQGEKRRVTPGSQGKVTVVVFWSMDSAANRAAVTHLDRLVDRYYRMQVRGISVVEKPPTKSHRSAPQFLQAQGIGMKTYYDDFSGLRKMANAARADVKWEVPCIFLVDRQLRVRLFKRGFSFSGAAATRPDGTQTRIVENAPREKRIETFLRRLVEER